MGNTQMPTQKKNKPSMLIRVSQATAVAVMAGGLFFAHSLSLADSQDDSAFTCQSAANVMDCINQTGTGTPAQQSSLTAVPINSQALGFTGPVSVGLRYDNYLAWILDVGYAQSFYNAAAAFKLSAGLNEHRANVTLGYSITPKQQIKLTYEYLAQNLPFDYAAGTVNEWVNQNALGGAYRYLLDNGIVRSLELYGNYTKANSKDLAAVEMYTDNLLTKIDYRRIAGGTQENVGGSVTLTPLKSTIVKLGAGYSSLSFDTTAGYTSSGTATSTALAYNAEVSQLLTPTVMVSGGIGNTASGSNYTAKVSKILPWSLEGALIGQYTATTNDIPGSTSVTASLSYPAPKTYTNMFSQGIGNLKEWVQQPVIYNTRVLAKAEEKIVQAQIVANPNPPAVPPVPVGTSAPDILTKNYFSFNQQAYDKIDYIISSLIQKGEPNNSFAPSDLNLQLKSIDPYNSKIVFGQMPASAMNPGNYTLTLQASGSRNGQVISQVQNSMDIIINGNDTLKAGTWNLNAKLTPATAGQPYPGTDLKTLVTDNSGLTKGDDFVFQLVSISGPTSPQWLQLSPDEKSLIAVPGTPVPNKADNPTKIVLTGKSTASNQPIVVPGTNNTQGQFDLVVNYVGNKPTWTHNTDALPQAYFNKSYSNDNGVNYNVGNYISDTGNSDADVHSLVYNCQECTPGQDSQQQLLPITGLIFYKNTGAISGTPSDFNQINGKDYTFNVVATNTSAISSDPHPFTIQLFQNTGMNPPSWGNTPNLPQASVNNNNDYNTDLNNYVTDNGFTGTLSYTVTKKDNCKWLLWDPSKSNILGGKPSAGDVGTCSINISALSAASGQRNSFDKNITVISGSVFSLGKTIPNATYQEAYYQQTGPINLNDGSYFSDGDTSDTFSFTPITLPKGMTLSGDGKLGGTPSDINSIDDTKLEFTVTSVNHSDTISPLTYSAPSFKVQSNPKLPFSATWNAAKLPLPTANNTVAYPNVDVHNYITYTTGDIITSFQFFSNSCSDWLQLDKITGILSGTPNQTGICSFVISVTSKATGLTKNIFNSDGITDTQTINVVSNAPVWKQNGIFNITIPYPTQGQTTITLEDDLASDPSKANFTNLKPIVAFPKGSNMMPDGIHQPSGSSLHYVYINQPDLNNDVDNSLSPSGSFTVTATNPTTNEPSTATFNIYVKANLKNPAGNGNLLPTADVGTAYNPIPITPYPVTPQDKIYMTKTIDTDTQQELSFDTLTFTQVNSGQSPNCDWATLSSDGNAVGGTPPQGQVYPNNACFLNFTIKSQKNGNAVTPSYVTIPISIPAVWDQTKVKNPQPLQFDATQDLAALGSVTPIDLNLLMINPSSGLYTFKLTQNDANNDFVVINNNLLLKNPTDNNLNGALAGTTAKVQVSAQNINGGTITPQDLTINITSDPNVKYTWDSTKCPKQTVPNGATQPTTSGIFYSIPFSTCIQTNAYKYVVQNNTFKFGDIAFKAVNTPNNPYSSQSLDSTNTILQIYYPTVFDINNDYNLTLSGINSLAGGDSSASLESAILTVPNNLTVYPPQGVDNQKGPTIGGLYSIKVNLNSLDNTRDYQFNSTSYVHTGAGGIMEIFGCPFNNPTSLTGCSVIWISGNTGPNPVIPKKTIGQDGSSALLFQIDTNYNSNNPFLFQSLNIMEK